MDPLVSIIVLTYNSRKYVLETLESIKQQTYRNIELIISDDCSSDDTVGECRKWINENRDRFTRAEIVIASQNSGIPANCNRGLSEARGEWVKFIAGDDLLFPVTIELFINEIRNNIPGDKLAFHGKVVEFNDDLQTYQRSYDWGDSSVQNFNRSDITAEEQHRILLRFCPVEAASTFLSRQVFEKVGLFDERFKYWEDRPMWLKMTSDGIKFSFVNAEVAKYRRHSDSVQINKDMSMFSRTTLSKDEAFRKIIVPELPFIERALNIYIISVRRFFHRSFRNKKTFIINLPYKALVFLPEIWLKKIKNRYAP